MATRYLEQSSRIASTDPFDDDNGEIYTPKWTGTMDVTYEQGPISFYYGLNWVGKMDSYEALGEDPATSIYQSPRRTISRTTSRFRPRSRTSA